MAKVIDFVARLKDRTEREFELRAGVERGFLRVEALNLAIEQMWEEGSDDEEIADTLRWAADELLITKI
jgi:hypothetical protein